MSIRAMFVGNAPAQSAAPASKKDTGDLAAAQRAEQELARAMLGEELPAPPPEKPAGAQPPRDPRA
jgi:hypothetical protein